jgi:deoxyribose-phosphate aldolase
VNLAKYIEHTCLRADARPERVERLCREAVDTGLFGVCVLPVYVSLAEQCLRGKGVRVVTVVGFPHGGSTPSTKAVEARQAVLDGADEIDMVMAIGLALAGGWGAVAADVRAVREAVPDATLKVIVETGYFGREEIRKAADVCVSAGADFIKTCTGYGPRGVTTGDVALLSEFLQGRAEIKASGGIRTRESALQMIEAGATRIGTSNGVEIVG